MSAGTKIHVPYNSLKMIWSEKGGGGKNTVILVLTFYIANICQFNILLQNSSPNFINRKLQNLSKLSNVFEATFHNTRKMYIRTSDGIRKAFANKILSQK